MSSRLLVVRSRGRLRVGIKDHDLAGDGGNSGCRQHGCRGRESEMLRRMPVVGGRRAAEQHSTHVYLYNISFLVLLVWPCGRRNLSATDASSI